MDKKAFRDKTLKKRNEIYSKEIDARIVDRFVETDLYKNHDWIMLYVSFGTEINTYNLIKRALADNKHIVVPICNAKDHTIILSEISNFPEDFEEGHYGILEVKEECRKDVNPQKLQLVVLPGMAFTEKGNRMGFGGGYYDRFLETICEHCITLALIREDFICDEVPMEAHDKSVQFLVTENRVIDCNE